MLTVTTVFDPETRALSYKEGSDRWAGTTEDNHSAQIVVEGIEALLDEYTAELVFGIPMYNNGVIYHPIGQIDAETQTYVLPNAILASARDGILPVELRLTKDSKVITSRNRLEISVVTAIDALRPFDGAYLPEIMGRSQEWAPDVQYAKGAIVIRDEVLYYSGRADNLGHDPKDGNISWWGEVSIVAIREYQTYIGDGVATQFTIAHHMLSPDLQFTVTHNGVDKTGDVTDMAVIDENNAVFTFSSPPQADTLLRINKAYRAISSPMWVWGMLESEEGMVAPEALFGVLEITDEKVTVRNGELGVNSSGRAYAGPEGLTKVLANEEDLEAHIIRTDNPHSVTKEQLGLQNVDPTSDLNKPISIATQTALNLKANSSDLTAHTGNTSNPHSVTKAQVGLSNVNNTSDTAKPISTATQTALNAKQDTLTFDNAPVSGSANPVKSGGLYTTLTAMQTAIDSKLNTTLKGAVNGLAELDANGKVPSSQLPSYVDDVLEFANKASFPSTGESGKIYIAIDDNKTYRWSGSTYTEISASIALGETSATAYRGDRGATAFAHVSKTDNPHGVTKAQVGLTNVANILQYSASNAPPYPVTSVAGKTGAVVLAEADIPALGAGKITSGTFADARIPALSISKITNLQTTLDGKVASNTAITAGTKTKITYDAKGLVTAGASLAESDIPSLSAGKITSGTFADARIPISIERTSNKISSWQTTPSDTAYPTEKLVKDSLDAKATASDLSSHESNLLNPHSVTKAQVGLSAVANELQYSASNPPPYPVTSVAGKTGAVVLAEADIPALSAGKITSGTFADARIPDLDADKIVSGIFADARIPALEISKITGLQTAISSKVTANAGIAGGTKTKITYDSKGLVTAGADLTDADVPESVERTANKVDSWQTTPTDTAYPSEKLVKDTFGDYLPLAGGVMTGDITLEFSNKILSSWTNERFFRFNVFPEIVCGPNLFMVGVERAYLKKTNPISTRGNNDVVVWGNIVDLMAEENGLATLDNTGKIPSAQLPAGLSVNTSWGSPLSDSVVPSEKLVKDSLDSAIQSAIYDAWNEEI